MRFECAHSTSRGASLAEARGGSRALALACGVTTRRRRRRTDAFNELDRRRERRRWCRPSPTDGGTRRRLRLRHGRRRARARGGGRDLTSSTSGASSTSSRSSSTRRANVGVVTAVSLGRPVRRGLETTRRETLQGGGLGRSGGERRTRATRARAMVVRRNGNGTRVGVDVDV